MDQLKETWRDLAYRYTGSEELINELWQEIEECYSRDGRHYHNLSHLKYMVEKATSYKEDLKDPDTVLFSIFYHDIIFDPKGADNEERSAGIAERRLSALGVPEQKVNRCREQILATKDHRSGEHSDTSFFIDFDLAILGEKPPVYEAYMEKVRREYSADPHSSYRKVRRMVLEGFLARKHIFHTDKFYEKYERQARENMKKEIEGLRA